MDDIATTFDSASSFIGQVLAEEAVTSSFALGDVPVTCSATFVEGTVLSVGFFAMPKNKQTGTAVRNTIQALIDAAIDHHCDTITVTAKTFGRSRHLRDGIFAVHGQARSFVCVVQEEEAEVWRLELD